MPVERRLRPINTEEIRSRLTSVQLAEDLRNREDLTPADRRVRFLLFKADQALSASRPGQRLFKEKPASYASLLKDVFNAYIEFGEDLPPHSR